MNEYVEALGELFALAHAGWDYTRPERRRFMEWLSDQDGPVQRRFRFFIGRVTTITRCAVILPFLIIGVAILCTPHMAHTIIPILDLASLFLLAWLGTTWLSLAVIAATGLIPVNTGYGIGAVISLFRKILSLLLLILLGELLVGVCFTIVPVSADPGLVPLFVLLLISLGIASIAVGKGWIRRILILLLIGVIAIFFLGGRNKASEKIGLSMDAGLNPHYDCPGEQGESKEFHNESFKGRGFDLDVPTTTEGLGCWSLVTTPDQWGPNWHLRQVNNDQEWKFYVMAPGQKPQGPFDWSDRQISTKLPQTFWIQGTKKGGRVHFWSDAAIPTITLAKVEVPMETENPPEIEKRIYTVGERGVVAPEVLKRVNAEYTEQALRAKFHGTVFIDAVVDEDGNLSDIKLVNPTGFDLDDKIIETMKQWTFKPGSKDGMPVPVKARAQMQFWIY